MAKVLPQNFLDSLIGLEGFDRQAFVEVHENAHTLTSVRLNPAKLTPATETLPADSVIPWCPTGLYLKERPSFTMDPVFHAGAYYVQEASSMFLDHIIREIFNGTKPPKRVVDLCAAPGGKSTLIAAALPDSFIVSNEVIKTRVTVLAENISKWGSDHVIVTNNDPKDFKKLPGYFDLMVVDAPCSGSGLFRKDPDAIDEWSEANVEMCSLRQQRILSDAIEAVNQDGYLIYSTCSYSSQEDEEICDWIVEQLHLEPVKIQVDEAWGIVETVSKKHAVPGYRFYPNELKGEGFFVACFRQTKMVDHYYGYTHTLSVASKQTIAIAAPYLKNPGDYILSDQKEIVIASLKKWEQEFAEVGKMLNVRKSGVAVGIIKGKNLIPHHEMALSHILHVDVQLVELTKEEALKYLKRQDLVLETGIRGWCICSYQHVHLGWMKVLPNRVNNYYPTNWRILKA